MWILGLMVTTFFGPSGLILVLKKGDGVGPSGPFPESVTDFHPGGLCKW